MGIRNRLRKLFGKKEIPELPKIKRGKPVEIKDLEPDDCQAISIYLDAIVKTPEKMEPYMLLWKYIYQKYPELKGKEDDLTWKLVVKDNLMDMQLHLMKNEGRMITVKNLPINVDFGIEKH